MKGMARKQLNVFWPSYNYTLNYTLFSTNGRNPYIYLYTLKCIYVYECSECWCMNVSAICSYDKKMKRKYIALTQTSRSVAGVVPLTSHLNYIIIITLSKSYRVPIESAYIRRLILHEALYISSLYTKKSVVKHQRKQTYDRMSDHYVITKAFQNYHCFSVFM